MKVPLGSELLLCISPDNHMLHVGPAEDVVPHLMLSAAPRENALRSTPRIALEIYDSAGRRIRPELLTELAGGVSTGRRQGPDSLGDPAAFAPMPEDGRVSPAELLRRIDEALGFVQRYLDDHPEAGYQGPNVPPATEVPRPEGSYPEVLEALARELAPLNPAIHSNRGNWFHNLWHAATGTS